MEKLRLPVTLSPEATEALRRLVHGTLSDKSPSIREVSAALTETGCTADDRIVVLAVIGLGDDLDLHPRRTRTAPPPHE